MYLSCSTKKVGKCQKVHKSNVQTTQLISGLCPRNNPTNVHTEGIMMKSIGITLNGGDPIPQQLKELDAQSRLLTGIERIELESKSSSSRPPSLL